MKKIMLAATAVMVLVSGVLAEDVNINNFVKGSQFDSKGYNNARNDNKNKDKMSESELLLRLVMMKEALRDAKSEDEISSMYGFVGRAVCAGTAQRLKETYGSFENMAISQQELRAGVVNLRKDWGTLCWQAKEQYLYRGYRDYNFEKAMWGQAYAMATVEKTGAREIQERIQQGDNLDSDYFKKRPVYKALSILRPLEVNSKGEGQKNKIAGYWVNTIDDVEENLFENVIDAGIMNGAPWKISQFISRPKDFIAEAQKNPTIVKYYNYMAGQIVKTDGIIASIEAKAEEDKRAAVAKAEEDKRAAAVKAEEDEKAAVKAEEEYVQNLPQLKNELLNLRKQSKTLQCAIGWGIYDWVIPIDEYKKEKRPSPVIVNIDGMDYVGQMDEQGHVQEFYKAYISPLSACYSGDEMAERSKITENRSTNQTVKLKEYAKFDKMHPLWGVIIRKMQPTLLEDYTWKDLREKFEARVTEELNK